MLGGGNFSAALVAVLRHNLFQFLANHQLESLGVTQDIEKISNFTQPFLVFVQQLFVFQTRQAMQTQL